MLTNLGLSEPCHYWPWFLPPSVHKISCFSFFLPPLRMSFFLLFFCAYSMHVAAQAWIIIIILPSIFMGYTSCFAFAVVETSMCPPPFPTIATLNIVLNRQMHTEAGERFSKQQAVWTVLVFPCYLTRTWLARQRWDFVCTTICMYHSGSCPVTLGVQGGSPCQPLHTAGSTSAVLSSPPGLPQRSSASAGRGLAAKCPPPPCHLLNTQH